MTVSLMILFGSNAALFKGEKAAANGRIRLSEHCQPGSGCLCFNDLAVLAEQKILTNGPVCFKKL